MIGTTLLYAPVLKEQPLAEIALLYEEDKFPTLELNVLLSLDFEMMLGDSPHGWSEGEPIINDEDDGLQVFKVNPTALAYILEHAEDLAEDEAALADLGRLRAFVAAHGSDAIYEWATF